jgi:molybdopterin converting factor small subunit
MDIYVSLKSIGKRKSFISKQKLHVPVTPDSLRTLITEIIKLNVQQFHNKEVEKPIVSYLSDKEIEYQASIGKVGFGAIYNENKADLSEAIQTAIQAFEDGLYRVFLNSEEVEQLETPLKIKDGDEVVFIRLTMLAGRMW